MYFPIQHTHLCCFNSYLFRCVRTARNGKLIFIARFDSSDLCTSSAKVDQTRMFLDRKEKWRKSPRRRKKPVEWPRHFSTILFFSPSSAIGVDGDQCDTGNGGRACRLENVQLYDRPAYKQWRQLFCRFAMADLETTDGATSVQSFRRCPFSRRQIQTQSVRWIGTAAVVPTETVFHFFVINPAVRSVHGTPVSQHGPSYDGNARGGPRSKVARSSLGRQRRNSSRRNILSIRHVRCLHKIIY